MTKYFRLLQIIYLLIAYKLDEFIKHIPLLTPIRWLLVLVCPGRWFNKNNHNRGTRIRLCLERLGPIFVKIGQLLSTRLDILPEDIAVELIKLQDQVPPFPGQIAKESIERALNCPVNHIFLEFDIQPLASASIAQVHAAQLINGKKVVVKVLRPRIKQTIKHDLAVIKLFAGILDKYWSLSYRLKPLAVVAELEKTLILELDLLREAANASQLRRNFLNSELLYIPEVYWDYCRENIMVAERIYGIPISDIENLKKNNVDLKVLAERGVEIFFTQVFRDCFFHADMHPGNIMVSIENTKKPKYLGVDFGIVGTLGPSDQVYLAQNLLAFFKRDYRKVAELHIDSGWVSANTRIDEFESAIRTVCEPIFERPLKDISFGQTLLRLFQVAHQFEMEVQPQLMLLQKTLISVEGLGRQLYPELDLWNTAKPYLENWAESRYQVKAILKEIKGNIPYYIEKYLHNHQNFHAPMHPNQLRNGNLIHKHKESINLFYASTAMLSTTIGILGVWAPNLGNYIQENQHNLSIGFLGTGVLLFMLSILKKS